MASLGLVFDILARDQASPTFRKVGDSAERAGKQAEGFGGRIGGAVKGVDGLVGSLKVAAAGFAGAAIVSGLKALYDQAAESARVGRLTTQVIKSTGGAANITAKQVGDLATAISNKTGVDDEAIQSGENLLLTFTNVRNEVGKGNDIFSQATGILTDMSVALGQDTSTSAIQLGKALNDPIKGISALQRVGVSFTQSQKDQIATLVATGKTMEAQKVILAELSKEFGGAAEAAATPFDKLKVQIGNVAEQLGSYLIPAVGELSNFVQHDVLPVVSKFADTVGPILGGALHVAGEAAGVLFHAAQGLADLFGALPGPLQLGAAAAGLWAIAGGKLVGALKPLGGLFGGIRGTASAFSEALGYARANGDGLTTVLKNVGSYAGGEALNGLKKLGAALGPQLGIAAAVYVVSELVDGFKSLTQASDEAKGAAEGLAGSLTLVNDAADRQTVRKAIEGIDGLAEILEKAGVSSETAIAGLLGNAQAQDQVTAALNRYKASLPPRGSDPTQSAEGVRQATLAYQALATGYDGAASSARYFGGAGGIAAGAAADTGTAADEATPAVDTFAQRLQDAADAAGAARSNTDLLKTSLDLLTGATVDTAKLEADFYDAVDAADGALKGLSGSVLDSAGHLNVQSEAGRKAQGVLFNIRDADNQLIASLLAQGATSEEVEAKDAQLRESFIRSAQQMGFNRQQAEDLANQILGIPAKRQTEIDADTTQAHDAVAKIQGQIDALHGKTVNVVVTASGTVQAILGSSGVNARPGINVGYAEGGILPGFTPGRDVHHFASVTGGLLDLSGGEAIMRPEFTRAVGSSFVGRMNKLAKTSGVAGVRRALGFADGGILINFDDSPLAATVAGVKRGVAQSFLPGPGGSVERWAGLVAQVLGILRQPSFFVGSVLRLIQFESGGNPYAINLTDINALRGDPSRGLTQTIGSTFNAYAGPYRGLGIYNPLANIYAGLNYGIHRYGSIANIPGIRSLASGGSYRPYDNGGILEPGYTLAYNGTGKRETVRTAEQEAALNQPLELTVYAQFGEETIEARSVRVAERVVTNFARGSRLRGARNG